MPIPTKRSVDSQEKKIRAKIKDPVLADKLIPNTTIGSKRICVETNYYETFNRDDVVLVDVNERPIERFTEAGLRVGGEDHQFDAVVLATGFDAMTGALLAMDIRGESGRALAEKWAGRTSHLSRPRHCRISEHVYCQRSRQSVRPLQHGAEHRVQRRLDC